MARQDVDRRVFWADVMRRFARSGASIRAFCSAHGLPESSFHYWRRELASKAGVGKSPAFVPLVVESPAPGPAAPQVAVEVVLHGGHVLRLLGRLDRAALADLVAVLEGRPC
jgi:transposase-like protein